MIFDNIKIAKTYFNLDEKIKKGLEFILNNDLNSFKNGKYEIDGEKITANIQEYDTKTEGLFEAHRKYIDIQYLINGFEKQGIQDISALNKTTEYDAEKDVQFFEGEGSYVSMKEGYFTIFYPQDGHKPCITDRIQTHVKKVVIKILI